MEQFVLNLEASEAELQRQVGEAQCGEKVLREHLSEEESIARRLKSAYHNSENQGEEAKAVAQGLRASLEDERRSSHAKQQELQGLLVSLAATMRELQSSWKTDRAANEEKVQTSRRSCSATEAALETALRELEAERSERTCAQKKLLGAEEHEAANTSVISELTFKRAQAAQELEEFQNLLHSSNARTEALQQTLAAEQLSSGARQKELSDVKELLASEECAAAELHSKATQNDTLLQSTRYQLKAVEANEESLQQSLEAERSWSSKFQALLHDVEERYSSSQCTVASLKSKEVQARDQFQQVQKQLETAEASASSLRESFQEQLVATETAVIQLRSEHSQSERESEELRRKLHAAGAAAETWQEKAEAVENSMMLCEKQLSESERNVAASESALAELGLEHRHTSDELRDARMHLVAQEDSAKTLQQRLESEQRRSMDHREQLLVAEERISSGESDIAVLRSKHLELGQELQETKVELCSAEATMLNQCKHLQAEKSARLLCQEQLQDSEEHAAAMQYTIDELNSKIVAASNEMYGVQCQLLAADTTAQGLKLDLDFAKEDRARAQEQLVDAMERVAASDGYVTELRERLQQVQETNVSQEAELQRAEDSVTSLRSMVRGLEQILESEKAEHAAKQRQLQRAKRRAVSAEAAAKATRQRLECTVQDLCHLHSSLQVQQRVGDQGDHSASQDTSQGEPSQPMASQPDGLDEAAQVIAGSRCAGPEEVEQETAEAQSAWPQAPAAGQAPGAASSIGTTVLLTAAAADITEIAGLSHLQMPSAQTSFSSRHHGDAGLSHLTAAAPAGIMEMPSAQLPAAENAEQESDLSASPQAGMLSPTSPDVKANTSEESASAAAAAAADDSDGH
eukprot:TRINITY_DN8608_c0_g1_i2.p1 TRINITY_DN8608_c0_g1~~TRINITY_DN8608_c0_g1_i2.p1  ORF type:complete len:866 (+),score=260.75 TRINITY_DN8608_c0_g1_i2:780-3377(+)